MPEDLEQLARSVAMSSGARLEHDPWRSPDRECRFGPDVFSVHGEHLKRYEEFDSTEGATDVRAGIG